MRAAVLYKPGEAISFEDVRVDAPAPNEVLIRVAACGVCHSDLSVREGKFPSAFPVIMGHEAAGVVLAVGNDVRSVRPGDHVVTCISGHCGRCEECLTGHMSLCLNKGTDRSRSSTPRLTNSEGKKLHQMTGINGFSETMLVSETVCVAIDPAMPLDLACVMGCAVITGWGAVVHTARVEAGTTVAVIGCGGVGLSAINAAQIAGASRIVAIDRVPAKLALAKQMGATDTIDAAETDIVERVRDLTRGGVHYSFEAIGLKPTVEAAFRMVKPGGTATIIGAAAVGTKFEVDAMDLLPERKLQGSYMGSNRFPVDLPRLIDLYLQGRLHLDKLVDSRIELDGLEGAFEAMRAGATARTVITFGSAGGHG